MSCNDLISVIVPVYNVETYLKRCVDTLIKQTYQNIEIILVDDGSTDSSGEICDLYKDIDSRITVIHKTNGGLSDARNCALSIVKGQCVAFVDSDDYLEDNYLEYLYELMISHSTEIAMCSFKYVNENGVLINRVSNENNVIELDQFSALKELIIGKKISTSASMKLYRTYLFDGIRYPKGRIYEDIATTYKILMKTKRVVISDAPLYNYLYRMGSITRSKFDIRKLDTITFMREMVNGICEMYPELKDYGYARLFTQYLSVYSAMRADHVRDKQLNEKIIEGLINTGDEGRGVLNKKNALYYLIVTKFRPLLPLVVDAENKIQYIRGKR